MIGKKFSVSLLAAEAAFLFFGFVLFADGVDDGRFTVMFWNLENFFDSENAGLSASDAEFSENGERRWTAGRFWKKVNGVSKTLLWVGENYGGIPAVVGWAEVENEYVVNMIARTGLLRKLGYRTVHFDSPDPRGIDVALMYREDVFERVWAQPYALREDSAGNELKTRDILLVSLRRKSDGELWHFLVNHHPSKYGGAEISVPKRRAAMRLLADICDSLILAGERNIVAMGDFNETPQDSVFQSVERFMHNHGRALYERGEGSIRYEGKWELIDMFFTDCSLERRSQMSVCRPPFLLVWDRRHSGYKPKRTYIGPGYAGGLSDHLPVVLEIVDE